MFCLSVGGVEFNVFGNFDLPPIAVLQKFLLVIDKFLASLGRKFEIWAFNNRIDRTRFLTKTTINALHHVNVIAHRAPCAVCLLYTSDAADD